MIEANNVTVKDTLVTHGSCGDRFNIDTGDGKYSGILIEDTEINGQDQNTGQDDGIGYEGFTCLRCNIHDVGEGANISDGVTFQDSWIHDLHYADGEHIEPIVSNGGNDMKFIHNNLSGNTTDATSAALALYGDFQAITNVLVENNLLNGGSYALYAGSIPGKSYPVASNVTISGNVFGTTFFPLSGMFGAVYGYASGNGNSWTNNTWLAGGVINP